jgi:hypothetical protein
MEITVPPVFFDTLECWGIGLKPGAFLPTLQYSITPVLLLRESQELLTA